MGMINHSEIILVAAPAAGVLADSDANIEACDPAYMHCRNSRNKGSDLDKSRSAYLSFRTTLRSLRRTIWLHPVSPTSICQRSVQRDTVTSSILCFAENLRIWMKEHWPWPSFQKGSSPTSISYIHICIATFGSALSESIRHSHSCERYREMRNQREIHH